jgi:hypothetical protein
MGDAAETALKKKYEQLKAKREAKQQQGSGDSAGGRGAGSAVATPGTSLSGILQQMEKDSGQAKSQGDDAKADDKEPGAVVKASALDPSAIAAFQAMRGTPNERSSLGGEPPAKRAKVAGGGNKLPAVPKRLSTAGAGGRDSEDAGSPAAMADDPPTSGAGGASRGSHQGDKIDGFPRRVHEALQRIFTEGSLRRDEMEDKILTALRALSETDALRALDQFGNEDMTRIRNKAAYLWGIVRNLREGRSKPQLGNSSPFGKEDDASSISVTYMKLLWPEEEKVMQDLGAMEGRLVEREYSFENSACILPPAESLYTDEPFQNSELARVRAELGQVKTETQGHDPVQWLKLTSQVSLTGRVVPNIRQTSRPELCSTSWVQFWELLSAYPLISPSCAADEKVRSLHLCDMSGASVAALNHYLKIKHSNMMLDWSAHTRFPEPAAPEPMSRAQQQGPKSEEESFIRETKDHWIFGGDAEIHAIDAAAIKAIEARAAANGNFDLVLADSGVMSDAHMHAGAATPSTTTALTSIPRDPARDISEAAAARVFLSQVVVALSTMAPKGSMVLRMWSLWEHQNVGLLFLVNCVFAEVKVCRPATVQLAGEDLFLVCTGFKGLGQAHRAALCGELSRSNANTNNMISKSNLPTEWLSQLKSCAQLFARLQAAVIARDLRLCNGMANPERHQIRSTRDAAAAHWRARFDCRPLPSVHDRIVREGIGVSAHHYTPTTGGGKQWYSIRGRFSKAAKEVHGGGGNSRGSMLEHMH